MTAGHATVRPREAGLERSSRRSLGVLASVFMLDGFLLGAWSSRVPAVQRAVHADAAALGVALLGLAAGALVAVPITAIVCRSRRCELVACATLAGAGAALLLPGLVTSADGLLLVLLMLGAGYGATGVAINSAAVQFAVAAGRPIVPRFHASFSAGACIGALSGSLAGAAGVSVESHLAVAGLVVTAGAITCAVLFRGERPPSCDHRGSTPNRRGVRRSRRLRPLLFAVAITGGSGFAEGSIASWAGINLRDRSSASLALLPLGYGVFTAVQGASRFAGTRVWERFGVRHFTVTSALLASIGLALALVPSLPIALAGYALAGVGLSCLVPIGTARAGAIAGGSGVAVSAFTGTACFLLGPPLIGVIAKSLGLATTLGAAVLAALVAAAAGQRLRDETLDTRDGVAAPTTRDA